MADIFDNLVETLTIYWKTVEDFDEISSIECKTNKEEIRCGKRKAINNES